MTLANEKHGSLYIMRHGKTDWNDKRYKEEKRDTERTFCAASKIRNQPPVIWIPYEAEETVKAGDRLLDKKGTFI